MRRDVIAVLAAVAGGAGAAGAIAIAQASPARPARAVAGTARVQGRFAATGRVTVAKHLAGVRRGERFSRSWRINGEECRASSCTRLGLRARLSIGPGRVTTVTLNRVSAGHYRLRRSVVSDALCRTRHISGTHRAVSELNVTVSKRREVNGVWYATALSATWSTSAGGCGTTATRSAATYAATVVSGVPASVLPTGSTTTTSTAGTTTTFPSSTGTTATVTTISSSPSPTVPTNTVPHGPQPEAG